MEEKLNILFCNFDIEVWRTDLLFKMVKQLDSRGHSCHYYNYKQDISKVAKRNHIPLTFHNVREYERNDFCLSNNLLEEAGSYSFGLNKRKKNTEVKDDEVKDKIGSFISCTHQIQEVINADIIVVWGGFRFNESSIITYAKAKGVRVVIFEYGYFRPYTLTFETMGLNYNNSLPREAKFYLDKYPDTVIDKAQFEQLVSPKSAVFEPIDPAVKLAFPTRKKKLSIENVFKLKNLLTKKVREIRRSDLDLNQRYIFVPFQVETDSQIIEFSNKIKSMNNLVALVSEAVDLYNKEFEDDLKVIFKPHPVDKSVNIDYIVSQLDIYSSSLISFKEETIDLIRNAELVMTINSTVGIEALINGKNVITLGSAFYNIDGLVEHCEDYDNLHLAINESLRKDQNFELIFKYIKYLREEYFSEIYYEGADLDSVSKLCDRLEQVK